MLKVIYVDNHLLVVNKPAGLLTQPSGTDQHNLEAIAKAWIKEQYNKPGNVFLEALHRLDKPVSGLVLFARTSKALSRLNQSMREKQTKKIYHALVQGCLMTDKGVLEHFLMHDEFYSQVVPPYHPQAKLARLHYTIKRKNQDCTLVEIELDTGRYHQIRAQFAAIGHPIIGDGKYGSRIPSAEGEIALHHYSLCIPHPITSEMLNFQAPKDF